MQTEEKQTKRGGAPKRNAAQKAADYKFIAPLLLKGVSLQRVADLLNAEREYELGKTQIFADYKAVVKIWTIEHKEMVDKYLIIELQKIERMEAEAWEAWERSKKPKTKSKTKDSGLFDQAKPEKRTTEDVTEERVGDGKWFDLLIKLGERRCKLLGLGITGDAETPVLFKETRKITFNIKKREAPYEEAQVVSETTTATIQNQHLIS